MSRSIAAKVEELVKVSIEKKGYEIVDVEYEKIGKEWYLRIFIDKPDGVGLEDCEIASRKIGQILDDFDIIKSSYILEVSSPGIERPLKKEKDFKRFLGSKVLIKSFEAIDGQKTFEGILEDFRDDVVTINSNNKMYLIELDKIASANLSVEF